MSEGVALNKVTEVLLATGNWMAVEAGSFAVDAYELGIGEQLVHRRGENGICPKGFRFKSGGALVFGPLDSIVAVKMPCETDPVRPPKPSYPPRA